jgi:hypothetical protein
MIFRSNFVKFCPVFQQLLGRKYRHLEKIQVYESLGRVLTRFDVLTAMIFQVQVFLLVTPCSVVVGYQHFGYHFCLQYEVKTDDVRISPQVLNNTLND